jgi:hypothetical protein
MRSKRDAWQADVRIVLVRICLKSLLRRLRFEYTSR